MTTMQYIVNLAGLVGTFAFALGGRNLCGKKVSKLKAVSLMLLPAFGGGLVRDLFILRCTPGFLSDTPSLLVAGAAIALYFLLARAGQLKLLDKPWVRRLLVACDAAGMGVFLAAGVDKAARLGAAGGTVLLSGVVTAIGGGIIASLVAGMSPLDVLRAASGYRAITVFHVVAYALLNVSHQADAPLTVMVMASTILCCSVRETVLAARTAAMSEQEERSPRLLASVTAFLNLTRAELFWSCLCPWRGRTLHKHFFVYRGADCLLELIPTAT